MSLFNILPLTEINCLWLHKIWHKLVLSIHRKHYVEVHMPNISSTPQLVGHFCCFKNVLETEHVSIFANRRRTYIFLQHQYLLRLCLVLEQFFNLWMSFLMMSYRYNFWELCWTVFHIRTFHQTLFVIGSWSYSLW